MGFAGPCGRPAEARTARCRFIPLFFRCAGPAFRRKGAFFVRPGPPVSGPRPAVSLPRPVFALPRPPACPAFCPRPCPACRPARPAPRPGLPVSGPASPPFCPARPYASRLCVRPRGFCAPRLAAGARRFTPSPPRQCPSVFIFLLHFCRGAETPGGRRMRNNPPFLLRFVAHRRRLCAAAFFAPDGLTGAVYYDRLRITG